MDRSLDRRPVFDYNDIKYRADRKSIDCGTRNAHAAKPRTKCMKNGTLEARRKAEGRFATTSAPLENVARSPLSTQNCGSTACIKLQFFR